MLTIGPTYVFYLLPLLIAVSVVFGATRRESPAEIVKHGWQTARWLIGFVLIIASVLAIVGWWRG